MTDTSTLSTSMPAGVSAPAASPSKRICSLDIMRGFMITAMVFTNDMADLVPVQGVPQFLRHMPGGVDGFTFVDLIIPIFMFLLGASIPLALGKRLGRGDSIPAVIGHIFIRAAALIVMGLMDVNRWGGMGREFGVMFDWPLGLWKFLAWSFIFVIWLDFPKQSTTAKNVHNVLRIAAIAGLIWLAVVFRTSKDATFATSWWGTLGQLGWSYLIASLAWLAFKKNKIGILVVFALMHAAYLAMSAGWYTAPAWMKWVGRSTITTFSANTVAGLCVGMLLADASAWKDKIRWALIFALAAAIGAVIAHPVGDLGYHMPSSSWSLSATAIALVAWAALYWLTDIKGFRTGLDPLRTVGQNSLLLFQLSRYGILCYWLTGLTFYDALAQPTAVGMARSFGYAILLAAITYFATKKRVFLKV